MKDDKERIVKNFDELANSQLKKDALLILEAGLRAIDTKKILQEKVKVEDGHFVVGGIAQMAEACGVYIKLGDYSRVFFVGIGKCAADAGEVFEKILGDYLSTVIVIDVRGVTLKKIISHIGTHPLPSETNVLAAQSVKELLESATERDLIITVISGGGSALLCLPHDSRCEMISEITNSLMQKGADIAEINTVRKHLSLIQGGQFAKLAYPAKIVSLIFSDVPSDDISTVASGPTVLDTTTEEDAEKILAKYGVLAVCELPDCEIFEMPKERKYFENVDNVLVLTNERGLTAMKEKAEDLGYRGIVVENKIQGEARIVGKLIASQTKKKACLLYGGETTVTIKNTNGKGGRNQELVLGALPYLQDGSVVVAVASDGCDNTDVAGVIGDRALFEKARGGGIDIEKVLDANNSYEFFKSVGGHIKIGKTGSNVSDLYFTLTE